MKRTRKTVALAALPLLASALVTIGCSTPTQSESKLAYPANNNEPPAAGKTDVKAPEGAKSLAQICSEAGKTSSVQSLRDFDPLAQKGERLEVAEKNAKGDKPYTMADLKVLEKKGGWLELLRHAEDIAPASRNADWDALVEKAASQLVASLNTQSDSFEGLMAAEAILAHHPSLAKSKEFMAKRNEVGKTAFKECFKGTYTGEECVTHMADFLKVGDKDPAVALAFAKLVRLNQNAYVAVPFFKTALEGQKDSAACSDEDLQLAVIAGLGLPGDYDNQKGAHDVASNACWSKLKGPIEAALIKEPSGYYRDNTCALLREKGEVK